METMIHVADARARLLAKLQPSQARSTPIASACGLALAHDIPSPISLPPFDNSAMDGYAVVAADTHGATRDNPVRLRIVDRVFTGSMPARAIGAGLCAEIATGAPVPDGADAVVMQEDTTREACEPHLVKILDRVRPWENVRFKGEDIRAGRRQVDLPRVVDRGKVGEGNRIIADVLILIPAVEGTINGVVEEVRHNTISMSESKVTQFWLVSHSNNDQAVAIPSRASFHRVSRERIPSHRFRLSPE